jgi:two-component system sensor histidine kinase KdpD
MSVGSSAGVERTMTAAPADAPGTGAAHNVLQRDEAAHPARWMAVRPPGAPHRDDRRGTAAYRVPMEAAGRALGSLWAVRRRDAGAPADSETRMLAAAADQVAQALEQERLRAEATSAELARRSELVKSSLLESVSHDLRTPLAAIRAAAGTLIDGGAEVPADVSEAAEAIDDEAARMNRIVGNLLEVSRIEAGGVVADLQPYDLAELVQSTLRHVAGADTDDVHLEVGADVPYVLADAVLLDQVLSNLIENALRHGAAPVRVAAAESDGQVLVTVEDGGAGVPPEALPQLFDKFYRVPGGSQRRSRGVGLGLTVARGLVDAMGGSIDAGPSALGGLAVKIRLPTAEPPANDSGET